MRSLAVVVCLLSAAEAGPPALEPHQVGTVSVSTPKGWAFTGDADKGLAVAQQDPKRKDAAQLLVMVSTNANATEDQVIDAITGRAAQGIKVVRRGTLPGGAGKLVVADGVTDGIAVRLGAIAVAANGALVFGMLVAKTSEFDALGGTDLVANVLASLHAAGGAAPAPSAPAGGPFMEPRYNEYGSLIIPMPARGITIADLAGEWSNNDGAGRAYASGAFGPGSIQSAVAASDTWSIDAKGNFKEKFKAGMINNGAVRGIDQADVGTISFDQRGQLVIMVKQKPTYYLVRGWFYGKDATIVKLNGPYYAPIPDKYLADENYNIYMNKLYVRRR